ncbi:hypothetical protein [Rugamonas sp.]|uniref:hypothetical protein n=1 Tax=Rugamonas sp. TaxID=1926287 RepID=UPI0026007829|nr:hypothetical protein [Rugamonas sp.]
MRRIALLLLPLLLSACVEDSATYYVTADSNEHTLTLQREQPYFWSDDVAVRLVAARLPDCQRRFDLDTMTADDVEVELFASGDRVWTLRAGKQMWQVDTQTCQLLPAPKGDPGQPLGTFKTDGERLVFEPATGGLSSGPVAVEVEATGLPVFRMPSGAS